MSAKGNNPRSSPAGSSRRLTAGFRTLCFCAGSRRDDGWCRRAPRCIAARGEQVLRRWSLEPDPVHDADGLIHFPIALMLGALLMSTFDYRPPALP